jgi:hypothetical protein
MHTWDKRLDIIEKLDDKTVVTNRSHKTMVSIAHSGLVVGSKGRQRGLDKRLLMCKNQLAFA